MKSVRLIGDWLNRYSFMEKTFVLAPLIVFFVALIFGASNVPIYDDYPQQFDTIKRYTDGQSVWEILFRQHNEHRLFTTYIVTLFNYILLGYVDLRIGVFISGLMLVGIWIFLISLVENSKIEHLFVIFIISVLVFLVHAFDSVWVGGTIQYYGVVLFGLLSLKYLNEEGWGGIVLSLLFLFLCIYSMASGVVCFIVGILYICLKGRFLSIYTLLYLIGGVIMTFFYFKGYHSPEHHPSILSAIKDPIFFLKYILVLYVSFFKEVVGFWAIGFIGIALFLYLSISIAKQFRRVFSTIDIVHFYALFILGILMTVALGRAGFGEIGQALSARYIINNSCLWSLLIIVFYKNNIISNLTLIFMTGVIALLFIGHNSKTIPVLWNYKKDLEVGMERFIQLDNNSKLQYPNTQHAGIMTRDAISQGYYYPPRAISSEFQTTSPTVALKSEAIKYNIIRALRINSQYVLYGSAFIQGYEMQNKYVKIGLVSKDDKTKMFMLDTFRENNLRNANSGMNWPKGSYFRCVLDLKKFGSLEKYDLYLIILDEKQLLKTTLKL